MIVIKGEKQNKTKNPTREAGKRNETKRRKEKKKQTLKSIIPKELNHSKGKKISFHTCL